MKRIYQVLMLIIRGRNDRQGFGFSTYNLIRTNKQTMFIPLFTAATLPFLSANVTELSAATAAAIALVHVGH